MSRGRVGMLVAVILASGVGSAPASPASGVSRTDLARATISAPTSASATGESDVAGQFVTVPPGGVIPWHSHPGQNFVAVKTGALSVYVGGADGCTMTVYPSAQGYLEHMGQVHSAKNEGSAPVEVYVTQVGVPVGAELRTVQANPGTANCPPDATAPAPTVENIVRAKISAPFDVPSTAASDVVMQSLVVEPGGTVGWHNHGSPTFVAVKSGTISFYTATAAGCTSQNYAAGQAYVEPVGTAHMGRNEGTTPVELYATYLAVPVGGALRGEEVAPTGANCPDAPTPEPASQLPRTGLPAGVLLTLAAGLVGAGTLVRRMGRRR
ncbi:MAG: cupin domain-containing protein [Acidimicrobiia bacterium]